MCQMSPDMISLIGAAVLDTLPDTATIAHPVVTQDAMKTPLKSYSLASAAVACRIESIDKMGGNEQMRTLAQNSKYIGKALYRILFPVSTDVRLDDKIVSITTPARSFKVVTFANSVSYAFSQSVVAVEFTGV